jgi:ketosteroid isomerase-like protein
MKKLLLALSLGILVASPLLAECTAADKKAFEDLDRAWGEASVKGDRAALEQFIASDFVGTNPGNAISRAEMIDNAVRDAELAKTHPQPTVTHDYYMINCSPLTATITHRNVITEKNGKVSYSRSVHFLEKRGGRWQAVGNAGTPLNAAGAVAYLEHEWNDADIKGDVAWFERHLDEDVTSISSRNGKIATKDEEIASMKTRKGSMTWAEIKNLNVNMVGDTAVVTGINHVKGTGDDGKPYDLNIAYTDVWANKDGEWKIIATQGTQVK